MHSVRFRVSFVCSALQWCCMSVTDGVVGRQADDGRDSPASTEQLTLVLNLFDDSTSLDLTSHSGK